MYGVLWSTPCLGILWLRYCATTLLRLGRPTSEPIPSVVGLNRLRHSACYLVLFWSFQLSPYTEIIQVLGPSSRDSKFPTFFSFVRSTEYRIWTVFSRENTKPPFVCLGLEVWNPRTGELDPAEPNLQGLESGFAKKKSTRNPKCSDIRSGLSRNVLWINRNPRVAELFTYHDDDHDRWPDDPLGHPLLRDVAVEPKGYSNIRSQSRVHAWLIDLIKSIILAIGLGDYQASYPWEASLLLPRKVTIFGLDTGIRGMAVWINSFSHPGLIRSSPSSTGLRA